MVYGEELILFVIYKKKNKLKDEYNKMLKYLKKNLKQIEIPKKIIPVTEMPKTKSGKIIKKKNC